MKESLRYRIGKTIHTVTRGRMRLKKGDEVVVITGKYKGVRGRILKAFPEQDKVIVESVNFIKRHTKPNRKNQQGGIIEKEAPIHVSNVMLYNSKIQGDSKVTKPIIKIVGDKRIRVCKKTGEELG